MLYDALTFADSTAEDRSLGSYLESHPAAWRAARLSPKSIPATQQRAILLVGEEGSGKTTELRRLAHEVMESGDVVYTFDFSHAIEVMNAPPHRVGKAVANYVINVVDTAVRRADKVVAFRASFHRHILGTVADANLTTVKDQYQSSMAMIPDDEMASNPAIESAVRKYESQCRSTLRMQHHLLALQGLSGRTWFLVDNLDHVGVGNREKILEILKTFSTSLDGNTCLAMGLRSEHATKALSELSHLRPITPVELDSDGAIWRIVEARIQGAYDFLVSTLSEGEPPDALLTSDVSEMQERLTCLQNSPPTRLTLERWFNGNVRQMLPVYDELLDRVHPDSPPAYTLSTVNNYLISHRMHPSVERILDPKPVKRSRGRDQYAGHAFVFHRLRILSYLNRIDNHQASVRDIELDFLREFSIKRGDTRKALVSLARRSGDAGALVRLTEDPEAILESDEALGNVLLMNAGRNFVEHTVFSCDFLAWIYDRHPRGALTKVDTRGTDASIKVQKSCAVTEGILLKAFVKEHPYIEGVYNPSEDDARWLNSYMRLFDYGVDQWFILHLKNELLEYARERKVRSKQLARISGRISSMCERLDQLAATAEAL